jgi:hypothetical protein
MFIISFVFNIVSLSFCVANLSYKIDDALASLLSLFGVEDDTEEPRSKIKKRKEITAATGSGGRDVFD